jgi:hypothetical protein
MKNYIKMLSPFKLTIKIPQTFREEIPIPLILTEKDFPNTFNNLQRQVRCLFELLITDEVKWNIYCSNTYRRLIDEFERYEDMLNNKYYLITKATIVDKDYSEKYFYYFFYYINYYYENKNKYVNTNI